MILAFDTSTAACTAALFDEGGECIAAFKPQAVSVPTAGVGAGTYNLLVRATDKAGNEGQPARASIRLIPPEEAEADLSHRPLAAAGHP